MNIQSLTRQEIEFLMQSYNRDEFTDRVNDLFSKVIQRSIEGSDHHQSADIVEAVKHHLSEDILEPLADNLWDDLICGELPENILQDIEETAKAERNAGGSCHIDKYIGTVAVDCSDGAEYFFQDEEAQNLLDRCPHNVDPESWILWQSIGW